MPDETLTDGDYLLKDGRGWFEIKGFAVWIRSTDEGIVVDIYESGLEMNESLGSTWALDADLSTADKKEDHSDA